MAGRFEGLGDDEWGYFEEALVPKGERGRGMPRVSERSALNSILYVLITGSRWCDLPTGLQWAHRSSAHRALKRWTADGTFFNIVQKLLVIAESGKLIDWSSGAIDGSFSLRKRWGQRDSLRLQG